MATTTWDTLLPYVLPIVRNVPKIVATNEIKSAAKAFCERSLFWRETLDTLVFPEGISIAEMEVPRGAIVCKVISFKLEGVEKVPDVHYTATTSEIILVDTPPRQVSGVVDVALRPATSATGLPDIIMEEWGDDIAKGAVAQLKSMAGSEWFDAAGAQVNHELFEQAIANARRKALVGIAPKNLQVAPRRLW